MYSARSMTAAARVALACPVAAGGDHRERQDAHRQHAPTGQRKFASYN
jgi:hypothetical protein